MNGRLGPATRGNAYVVRVEGVLSKGQVYSITILASGSKGNLLLHRSYEAPPKGSTIQSSVNIIPSRLRLSVDDQFPITRDIVLCNSTIALPRFVPAVQFLRIVVVL